MSSSGAFPGYQGSEHSGVQVIVYPKGTDPGMQTIQPIALSGSTESDDSPSVVSVQTQKSMNGGSFSVSFKLGSGYDSIYPQIIDDDWVDIVMVRNNVPYHVMRGMVNRVGERKAVSGNGTTTETYTIAGSDFQKPFQVTPIFFNMWTNQADLGGATVQIMGNPCVQGNVPFNVKKILQGFLAQQGTYGRSLFTMPIGMPNTGETFVAAEGEDTGSIVFDESGYHDSLFPRVSVSQNYILMDAMIWDLAKQWSDPLFCEMYTELLPTQGGPNFSVDSLAAGLDTSASQMTVVIRDKPFVVVDPTALLGPGMASPWFNLPLYTIYPQDVVLREVGRSGDERFNAFFVSPQLVQEYLGGYGLQLSQPLWDPDDILNHGLRRFDIMSRYIAVDPQAAADDSGAAAEQQQSLITLTTGQRAAVRDWYCVNPYLLNGTIALGRGAPDFKIGTRLRIKGTTTATDETYYMEEVSHSWDLWRGMRTSAGITRGFIGSDADLVDFTTELSGNYTLAPATDPGDL